METRSMPAPIAGVAMAINTGTANVRAHLQLSISMDDSTSSAVPVRRSPAPRNTYRQIAELSREAAADAGMSAPLFRHRARQRARSQAGRGRFRALWPRLGDLQLCRIDGQRADSLPRRAMDRVANRRCNRRHPRLSDATRRCATFDYVNVGLRRDVDARQEIIVEIALFDL